MSKTRPLYPPEFRCQMVELVRAGRNPEELARGVEPSAQAIRDWVKQANRDEGLRSESLTTLEREELSKLRSGRSRTYPGRPRSALPLAPLS